MPYSIRLAAAAEKDLNGFCATVRERLTAAIRGLADNPRPPGALKMQGFKSLYRLRVGQYRIAYEIHGRELLVLVTAAGDRKNIYSLLKRRPGK